MPVDYHLIVDLEATCCNDGSFPKEEMEIIEIGAVMLSSKTHEIVSEFQTFIKPVRHPQLTDFCKTLTSISQSDINNAPNFKEAINLFQTWIASYNNFDFCSWGFYDRNQLENDCRFHQIASPLSNIPHRNLKLEFSKFLGVSKGYGMSKALSRIGIQLTGIHHRGIDDARNIAKIFYYMYK